MNAVHVKQEKPPPTKTSSIRSISLVGRFCINCTKASWYIGRRSRLHNNIYPIFDLPWDEKIYMWNDAYLPNSPFPVVTYPSQSHCSVPRVVNHTVCLGMRQLLSLVVDHGVRCSGRSIEVQGGKRRKKLSCNNIIIVSEVMNVARAKQQCFPRCGLFNCNKCYSSLSDCLKKVTRMCTLLIQSGWPCGAVLQATLGW